MGKRGRAGRVVFPGFLILILIISPMAFSQETPEHEVTDVRPAYSMVQGDWGKVQSFQSEGERVILKGGLLEKAVNIFTIVQPVQAQSVGCCKSESHWCDDVSESTCCGGTCPSGLFTSELCSATECMQTMGCCIDDCEFKTLSECGYPGDSTVFDSETYCEENYECETGVCAVTTGGKTICTEGTARKDCPYSATQNFYPGLLKKDVSACMGGTASTGTISGTVKDLSGNPLGGVTVTVQTGLSKTATTGSTGTYSITGVLIGTYKVTAQKLPYNAVTNDSVTVVQDAIVTVDFEIDTTSLVTAGTITGHVWDESVNIPLPGAYVYWSSGGRTASAYADAQGAYSLAGVDSGSVSITATAGGYDPETKTGVTVTAGGLTSGQDFILDPSSSSGICGNGVIDSGETCDIGGDNETGTEDDVDSSCNNYCTSSCRCPTSCSEVQGFGDGHLCYFKDYQCTTQGGSYLPTLSSLTIPKASTPPFDDLPGDSIIGIPGSEATVGCCNVSCREVPDCLVEQVIANSYESTGDYCKCGDHYFETSGNQYYCCSSGDGSEFSAYTCQNIVLLKGKVMNKTNSAAIASAHISLYENGNVIATATSGADGNYTLQVNIGRTYTLLTTAGDYYEENSSQYSVVDGQDPYTFNIYLTPTDPCTTDPISKPTLTLTNVMGKPSISLQWDQKCLYRVTSFEVMRRVQGAGSFSLVSYVNPETTTYIDSTSEWDTTYEYYVTVHATTGDNQSATLSIFTGNEICENKTSSSIEFCVNGTNGLESDLTRRVVCDSQNTLKLIHNGVMGHEWGDCVVYGQAVLGESAYCRYIDATHTECTIPDGCEELGLGVPSPDERSNIFGLFYNHDYSNSSFSIFNCTHEQPKGGSVSKRFCYYDHSMTSVDTCSSCKGAGTCFDYLSEGACLEDNCGYGRKTGTECAYYSSLEYFKELGKGICYPVIYEKTDKCTDFCGSLADGLFRNKGCTEELCRNLGDCYSGGDECIACTSASKCSTYKTELSCEGPDGIPFSFDLDCGSDTEFTMSDDSCGLGRCRWSGTSCIKDGDANQADDCLAAISPETCQSDNSPPTSLVSYLPPYINIAGAFVNFTITDGVLEQKNLSTYECISVGDCCPTGKIENDGKAGFFYSNETAGLSNVESMMNISYYSKDRHNNVESIKRVSVLVDTIAPRITDFSYTVTNYTGTEDKSRVDANVTISDSKNFTYCEFSLSGGPGNINLPYSKYFTLEKPTVTIPFSNAGATKPGLLDGTYLFQANCRDTTNNSVTFQENVYVNRLNKIYWISPNSTRSGNSFKYALSASDEYYRCKVETDAGDVEMIKDVFNSFQFFSSDVTGYADGTYSFPVYCYETDAAYTSDQPSAGTSVLFTMDNTPPETNWKRSDGGSGYVDLNLSKTYAPMTIKGFCVDPDIDVNGLDVHFPPLGEFGCNATYSCTRPYACSVQNCSGGPFEKTTQYTLSSTGTTCLCSYSQDKGGNKEGVQCHDLKVDNQEAYIVVTAPYDEFATTLSYQLIEFEWDHIVPPARVILTWRSGNMIDHGSAETMVYEGKGNSTLIIDELYPGKNLVEVTIYGDNYVGGAQGQASSSLTIYYDTIGPNLSSVQILNDKGKRIDNWTAQPLVAGFNTNVSFQVDANDIYFRDPLGKRDDDISRVYMEIYPPSSMAKKGPYEMNLSGGSTFKYVYDPSIDGYLFSGKHTVVFTAIDTAYNPNQEYNLNTTQATFTINETLIFTPAIYNSQNKRIDKGGFSEFGTPITINATVSNPVYITNIDVGITCVTDCLRNFTGAYVMGRASPTDPSFTLTIQPEKQGDGSYSLMSGVYNVTFVLTNMDTLTSNHYLTFMIDDTLPPTFNITLVTPDMNGTLPIVTSGKNGIVRYYDVIVNASEPVNISSLEFEVYKPKTKATALETFMEPVITNYWQFRMAVPLTDSFFQGLSGNNTRFLLTATDLSGNNAGATAILSGRYFSIDTFGGNAPVLDPDIKNLTVFTQRPIDIRGRTDPAEENISLNVSLSGIASTHLSVAGGNFSAAKQLQDLGGNDLIIFPKDYLGNIGGTTARLIIFDDTGLVFQSTSPLEGERLPAVSSVTVILFDGETAINQTSLNMTVNGAQVSFKKTVIDEYYLQMSYQKTLSDGNYTVFVKGANNAGMTANLTFSFIVDSTVPSKPTFDVTGATYYPTPHERWYIDTGTGFVFTAKFVPDSGTFRVTNASVVGNPAVPVSCTGSGSLFTCTAQGPIADGTYTVRVVASTLLSPGIYGSPGTYEFMIEVDTAEPNLTLGNLTVYTKDRNVIITGSYEGLDPDDNITLSGDVEAASIASFDTRRHTFTGTAVINASQPGNYTVFVTAVDKAGNIAKVAVKVAYDTLAQPVVITAINVSNGNIIKVNETYYVTNAGTEKWALTIDGTSEPGTISVWKSHMTSKGISKEFLESTVTVNETRAFSIPLTLGQADGENYIRIEVTDLAGNKGTTNITIMSDTTGADLLALTLQLSEAPIANIGSTSSQTGISGAQLEDCGKFVIGTMAYDSCLINRALAGDDTACEKVTNVFLKHSCKVKLS